MYRSTFGYIYVLRLHDSPYMFSTKSIRGCSYKIGKTKDPEIRTRTLGLLLPYPSEIITIFPADMHWGERYIHGKLSDMRINGEWFALTRPFVEWLIVLGCPYICGLSREHEKEIEGSFLFYAERLHHNSE
jgi:hypothetical protein